MSSYLHGIHDPGGEGLMAGKPGWVVVTRDVQTEGPIDWQAHQTAGYSALVRLNWGYGATGTIPKRSGYATYAQRCANVIQASRGVTAWILGNEPNHEQERPEGRLIPAEDYALCFQTVHAELTRRGLADAAKLMPAPVAPWSVATGDWLDYWARVLGAVGHLAGGPAIHAYTHGSEPGLARSDATMDPPYQERRYHLRAYRDLLAVVPERLRHLPVYLTECNQGDPWADSDNGWASEVLGEINEWNHQIARYGNVPGEKATQTIQAVCFYRWLRHDPWTVQGKPRAQAMIRAACSRGYASPGPVAAGGANTVHLPVVLAEAPDAIEPPGTNWPVRDWDPRLTERGVAVDGTPADAGTPVWAVIQGVWFPEGSGPDESQGRHHILLDVRDEAGKRLAGVPLRVTWPGGSAQVVSEQKDGELWAANYPMSPSRNEFAVTVADGVTVSERVVGIGMGADAGGGFNAGAHTSTGLVFQRVRVPGPGAPKPEQPEQPSALRLAPPLPARWMAAISQRFGTNPDVYSRFAPGGVPLRGHNGLDFAAPEGTPVRAVAAGQVAEVNVDAAGYGLYVRLRHDWGESLYAHLSHTGAQVGQVLATGDPVGLVGDSGFSTGPHLHLGVRVNPYRVDDGWGGYRDPAPLLAPAQAQPEPAAGPRPSAGDVHSWIRRSAEEFRVPFSLWASLVWAESSYRWWAESGAGAMGLAQIMQGTWDEWAPRVGAVDPWAVPDNLRVGAAYMAWLRSRFPQDERRAVAAYAFGIGNVQAGREWPAALREYVNKVMHGHDLLRAWKV